MSERAAPANVEAEKNVLGAGMLRPLVFPDIAAALDMDDFFLPAHREIYDAMGAVVARQMPCDPVMVGDELKVRGMMARLPGGEPYLMELASSVSLIDNFPFYVSAVVDAATRRRVIALCAATMSRAYGAIHAGELVETLSADLARLVIPSTSELCNAGELVGSIIDDIERRQIAGPQNAITGVRTGVAALDRLTCGSDPGDLVVLAADPGGGKTALANQSAIITAILEPGTALVVNLEMSKAQLVERGLVYLSRLNSFNVRRGEISLDDFKAVFTAGSKIVAGRLYVEDKLFTLPQILTRARAWRTRHPKEKAVMVVDYVQLMRSVSDSDDDNRARQIGVWCQTLKELAKQLEIVVVLVSQFNRGHHKDKRPPRMSDLRESGAIEAAADTIVLIHNPDATEDGQVDLILEKNRKGPARRVPAHWMGRYYEFVDVGDEPAQSTQQRLPGAD